MHCLSLRNQKYLQGQDCTCHPQKTFSPSFQQRSIHEADLGTANCNHVAVEKKKIAVWVIWGSLQVLCMVTWLVHYSAVDHQVGEMASQAHILPCLAVPSALPSLEDKMSQVPE